MAGHHLPDEHPLTWVKSGGLQWIDLAERDWTFATIYKWFSSGLSSHPGSGRQQSDRLSRHSSSYSRAFGFAASKA